MSNHSTKNSNLQIFIDISQSDNFATTRRINNHMGRMVISGVNLKSNTVRIWDYKVMSFTYFSACWLLLWKKRNQESSHWKFNCTCAKHLEIHYFLTAGANLNLPPSHPCLFKIHTLTNIMSIKNLAEMP